MDGDDGDDDDDDDDYDDDDDDDGRYFYCRCLLGFLHRSESKLEIPTPAKISRPQHLAPAESWRPLRLTSQGRGLGFRV